MERHKNGTIDETKNIGGGWSCKNDIEFKREALIRGRCLKVTLEKLLPQGYNEMQKSCSNQHAINRKVHTETSEETGLGPRKRKRIVKLNGANKKMKSNGSKVRKKQVVAGTISEIENSSDPESDLRHKSVSYVQPFTSGSHIAERVKVAGRSKHKVNTEETCVVQHKRGRRSGFVGKGIRHKQNSDGMLGHSKRRNDDIAKCSSHKISYSDNGKEGGFTLNGVYCNNALDLLKTLESMGLWEILKKIEQERKQEEAEIGCKTDNSEIQEQKSEDEKKKQITLEADASHKISGCSSDEINISVSSLPKKYLQKKQKRVLNKNNKCLTDRANARISKLSEKSIRKKTKCILDKINECLSDQANNCASSLPKNYPQQELKCVVNKVDKCLSDQKEVSFSASPKKCLHKEPKHVLNKIEELSIGKANGVSISKKHIKQKSNNSLYKSNGHIVKETIISTKRRSYISSDKNERHHYGHTYRCSSESSVEQELGYTPSCKSGRRYSDVTDNFSSASSESSVEQEESCMTSQKHYGINSDMEESVTFASSEISEQETSCRSSQKSDGNNSDIMESVNSTSSESSVEQETRCSLPHRSDGRNSDIAESIAPTTLECIVELETCTSLDRSGVRNSDMTENIISAPSFTSVSSENSVKQETHCVLLHRSNGRNSDMTESVTSVPLESNVESETHISLDRSVGRNSDITKSVTSVLLESNVEQKTSCMSLHKSYGRNSDLTESVNSSSLESSAEQETSCTSLCRNDRKYLHITGDSSALTSCESSVGQQESSKTLEQHLKEAINNCTSESFRSKAKQNASHVTLPKSGGNCSDEQTNRYKADSSSEKCTSFQKQELESCALLLKVPDSKLDSVKPEKGEGNSANGATSVFAKECDLEIKQQAVSSPKKIVGSITLVRRFQSNLSDSLNSEGPTVVQNRTSPVEKATLFKMPFPVKSKLAGEAKCSKNPSTSTSFDSSKVQRKAKRTWLNERASTSTLEDSDDEDDSDVISLFAESDFGDELDIQHSIGEDEMLCNEDIPETPLEQKVDVLALVNSSQEESSKQLADTQLKRIVIKQKQKVIGGNSEIVANVVRNPYVPGGFMYCNNLFKGYCFRFLSRFCNLINCRFEHGFPQVTLEWDSALLINILEHAKWKKYDKFFDHIYMQLAQKAHSRKQWDLYFKLIRKFSCSPEDIGKCIEKVLREKHDSNSIQELMDVCTSHMAENPFFVQIVKYLLLSFKDHLAKSVEVKPLVIHRLLSYCTEHDVDDFSLNLYNFVKRLPGPTLQKISSELLKKFFSIVGGEAKYEQEKQQLFALPDIGTQGTSHEHDASKARNIIDKQTDCRKTVSRPVPKEQVEVHGCNKVSEPIKLKRTQYTKPLIQLNSSDNAAPTFQKNYTNRWENNAGHASPNRTYSHQHHTIESDDKVLLQKSIEDENYNVIFSVLEKWAEKAESSPAAQATFTNLQRMTCDSDISFFKLLHISDCQWKPLRKKIIGNFGMNRMLKCMEKDEWNHAFEIYTGLQSFNIIVEETEVTDKLKTACTKILSCAEMCIHAGKLQNAITLLKSKNLFTTDVKQWKVEGSVEDIDALQLTWSHIFHSLMQKDPKSAYDFFMELQSYQEDKNSDPHLVVCGVAVISVLLEGGYYKEAVSLYTCIEDSCHSSLEPTIIRMLLVALLRLKKERTAKTLFYRATMMGNYPHIKTEGNMKYVRVYSYMTKEEIILVLKQLLDEILNESSDTAMKYNKYKAKIFIMHKEPENDRHKFDYLKTMLNSQKEAQRRIISALCSLEPPVVVGQESEDCVTLDADSVQKYLQHIRCAKYAPPLIRQS